MQKKAKVNSSTNQRICQAKRYTFSILVNPLLSLVYISLLLNTFFPNVQCYFTLYKKVIVFPVPSRDVTNQNLPGRELLNYSRPGRVWFSDIPAGDGKMYNLFIQCTYFGVLFAVSSASSVSQYRSVYVFKYFTFTIAASLQNL